jgi:hypothetical protein
MLKQRTHTFYLNNLEKNHPLKKLYKKPNEKNIAKFENWKKYNDKYTDNCITNVRIVFD